MSEYGSEIDKVLVMMPYLRQLYGGDAGFDVSTVDKYVYYDQGRRLDMGVRPGDPVKEGGVTAEVLRTGQRKTSKVGQEVFGLPFYGTSVPILEDGRVVGCLSVTPVEIEDRLQDMAQKMRSSVESVSSGFAASAEEPAATFEEISAGIHELEPMARDLTEVSGGTGALDFSRPGPPPAGRRTGVPAGSGGSP